MVNSVSKQLRLHFTSADIGEKIQSMLSYDLEANVRVSCHSMKNECSSLIVTVLDSAR